MAYNPFDFFRRNQKTAFAVLTIFVMFTFVLSAGQGDFFQWLPGWLGSFKNRGKEVMATVDGRKVYDAELAKHDDNRALADQFMREILREVAGELDSTVRDGQKTAGKNVQEAVAQLLRARQTNYVDFQMLQFMQQFGQQISIPQVQMQTKQRIYGALQSAAIAPAGGANSADAEVVKAAQQLMELDERAELIARGGYFYQVAPSKTYADRLEYDLWLRKADKLGVVIRPADTPAFVKQDFNGLVTPDVWSKVEKSFATKQGFTRDRLEAALADEFRVRTAANIVFGKANLAFAPYETYQFYKEQCEAATYTAMAVPAENFLNKVTATPTDAELRDLFDKYKNAEPDPTRETPGFREPRKLKVQWLEVKGDEPYFKKLGDEAFKLSEVGAHFGTLGFGPTTALAAPAVLGLADPQLQGAYAGYKVKFEDSIRFKWYPFRTNSDEIIDTSVVRPQTVAAALGAFVGSGLTKASPLVAALTFKERATQFDRNDRARVLGVLLSPSGVAGTNVLGNALAAGAAMPRPLPLPVVRTELLDEVKAGLTLAQAEKDVQTFAKELTRLGTKKDKSDARGYADKYVAERGLKLGGSTEFRDVYSIDDDPGLAVLADKLQRGHGMSDIPIKFGPRFFANPRDPRGGAATQLSFYEPQPFPNTGMDAIRLREGESNYLTWRTESIEAASPREFAPARPKVEAAWRRLKARELAKAAAEELKKKIDDRIKEENALDQKGKVQAIASDLHRQFEKEKYGIDAEAFLRSKYFSIEKVAPLRVEGAGNPFDTMNRGEQAAPFQLANLVRREMPNPSPKMRDDLLATRDKPRGTTLLEADRANDVFYVAVLVDRDELGLLNFRISDIAEGRSPLAGAVRQEERMAAVRKLREDTLALLKAEFRVANESEKLKEKSAVE